MTRPYLQLHNISTSGGTYKPSSHVHVFLVEGSHVPGLLIVIHYLQKALDPFRVAHIECNNVYWALTHCNASRPASGTGKHPQEERKKCLHSCDSIAVLQRLYFPQQGRSL